MTAKITAMPPSNIRPRRGAGQKLLCTSCLDKVGRIDRTKFYQLDNHLSVQVESQSWT